MARVIESHSHESTPVTQRPESASIAECSDREITELVEVIRSVDAPYVAPVVTALVAQLERIHLDLRRVSGAGSCPD